MPPRRGRRSSAPSPARGPAVCCQVRGRGRLGAGAARQKPGPAGGPARATFYPGRRSTRLKRKNGQRAQRPCWAAARGVPGCGDLPRSLCLCLCLHLARGADLLLPARLATGAAATGPPSQRAPAGSRAGGRRGRGLEGRDAGTGRARAACPPAAALRRPGGGGESRGPARCGEGTRGDPAWPVTCDRWPPPLGETWAAPLTSGPQKRGPRKGATGGEGVGGGCQRIYFSYSECH